jgi:hypothetical protein
MGMAIAVGSIPVLIMLAACLLAHIESALVPGATERGRRALPTRPSPAPPSRRLTLVAEEAPEAPSAGPALREAS